MAQTFKTSEGKGLAQLLARSLAFEWCGSDQDADKLRLAVARFLYDQLLRADVATDGKSSKVFAQVIKDLGQAGGQVDPIFQVQISPDECGAQRLAQILCGALPPQLRSLQGLIKSFAPAEPGWKGGSASASTTPTVSEDQKKLASQIQALALPVTNVSSRWPTIRGLGDELQRRLHHLKGLACASVLLDIDAWLRTVPLQAAKSEAVALALQTAFKAMGDKGIVNSNAQLGNKVHKQLAASVARDLTATRRDVILVAENDAYVGSNPKAHKLEIVQSKLEQLEKDYSLSVLAQARGSKSHFMVRADKTEVSREDLVLFKGALSTVATGTLGLEGRPEIYEVKPLTRLTEAVSQVTAYAWNYMIANVFWKCFRLTKIPGATISNSVMVPADPDFKTISLPTISIGTIALAASNFKLDAAPAEIAKLAVQFLKKVVVAQPFIAIPFMVTGLYGVIPYIVIDVGKLAEALEAVVSAALAALITALLAYLAAKKAAKELLEEIEALVKQIELIARMFVELMFAWTMFCLLFVGAYLLIAAAIAEAPILVPLAAAALLVIVVSSQASGGKDSSPQNGAPPPTLDILLGALHVRGLTADQFASWMGNVGELFAKIWAVTPEPETVDVAPLQ